MKLLVSIVVLICSFQALAREAAFTGFVKIAENKELYVEYTPAESGKPTAILLNGLTYSTEQWSAFAEALTDKGYGVLSYDPIGMGKTLVKYAPSLQIIPIKQQAEDLKDLLQKIKFKGPYNLVGLSYGGGLGIVFAAQYPKAVKNLVLMAPYTQPLSGQDSWIKSQIWATRAVFPFNKLPDDDLYDYFLKQIIYATYPQSEPIVLENPFKLEGIFNLVRGIRKLDAETVELATRDSSVHLMVAANDQYVPRGVMDAYWDSQPEAVKGSRILIYESEHKIVEAIPKFSASWVAAIMDGNPAIKNQAEFKGYPFAGKAKSDKKTLKLDSDNPFVK